MSTGWNGAAHDLEFTFALDKTQVYVGGAATFSACFPGMSEIQNMFAEYRIRRAAVRMYYSNNVSSLSSPSTGLPLLTAVFNPDDANSVALSDVLQYPNSRTFQLGTLKPPSFTVVPRPLASVYTTSGVVSGLSTPAPWISTSQIDVPHYGVKIVYDSSIVTNVGIGNVNFYFDLEFECRNAF